MLKNFFNNILERRRKVLEYKKKYSKTLHKKSYPLDLDYKHLKYTETRRVLLKKFLLVLSIFVFYFIFITLKFGVSKGLFITFLTWSFFVFCTPVADAGILLDLPIRLSTGLRMVKSEILVWIIAFFINVYALIFKPFLYDSTIILKIFKQILLNPYPYWAIIFLSAIGTFLSIIFGDELFDVIKHEHRKHYHKHKNKYYFILVIFLIVAIVSLYHILLKSLGINII